ncbi:retrotransposon protein, putative, Ty3-gypsy subclass [Hordeum vulgare]|nr:retrotransposon protein, putative, Ty3-gypsy subclass [Hordeum vulgare]
MVTATRTSTFGNPSIGNSSENPEAGGSTQAGGHQEQPQDDIPPPPPPPKNLTMAQFLQALRNEHQENIAAIQKMAHVLVDNPQQGWNDNGRSTLSELMRIMAIKKQEFRALKQGSSSVKEYLQKFNLLSSYALDNVSTEAAKIEPFMEGLQHISRQCPNKKTDAPHPNAPNQGQGRGAPPRNQAPHNPPNNGKCRVNHVSAEEDQEDRDVILGLVSTIPPVSRSPIDVESDTENQNTELPEGSEEADDDADTEESEEECGDEAESSPSDEVQVEKQGKT